MFEENSLKESLPKENPFGKDWFEEDIHQDVCMSLDSRSLQFFNIQVASLELEKLHAESCRQIPKVVFGEIVSKDGFEEFLQRQETILTQYANFYTEAQQSWSIFPQDDSGNSIYEHNVLGIDGLWRIGILPVLHTSDNCILESNTELRHFIEDSYLFLHSFHSSYPFLTDYLAQYLGILSMCMWKLTREDLLHRQWSNNASAWLKIAIAIGHETGWLHNLLGHLHPKGTISHIEEVLKSVSATNPFHQTRDEICKLIKMARIINIEARSALLLRTIWVLLEDSSQEEIDDCLREWERRIREIRQKDKAFGKFALTLSVFLISSLFEFGATTAKGISISLLRLSLEENLDPMRQFNSDGIARTAQLYSQGMQDSIYAIQRASRLVFAIFNNILDQSRNECTHPVIHAFLAFLKNVASSSNCLQHFGQFVPWPKIVTFLNRLSASSRGRGIAETACRQVLPEDAEMADLIFYAKIHLDQSRDLSVPESPLVQSCRELRMLGYGYHLASHEKWFLHNGTAFEVMPDDVGTQV